MSTLLDAAAKDSSITTNPDFTVLLETAGGRRYVHSHGASSPTTRYESASTSKWVTAAIMLDLVDRGMLRLDTRASQHLAFWQQRDVDVRSLLSFTSGFTKEPPCVNLGAASYATCVRTIYDDNVATAAPAGTTFDYGSAHMHVAGLLAMRASNVTSWTEVFDAWRARTQLFPTAAYDIPSASNPRIASGMHWTGDEYLGFLRALYRGEILSPAMMTALHANQRGTASVVYSPIFDSLGEDWSYALGNWIECPTARTAGSFNCTGLHRNSSAGAYGAYPFIDFDGKYFGLVARRGALNSEEEGIAIARTIDAVAREWAARCTGS